MEHFEIPNILSEHFCFYEVIEQENYFDETVVEDHIRISDILGSWEFSLYGEGIRIRQ